MPAIIRMYKTLENVVTNNINGRCFILLNESLFSEFTPTLEQR